MATKLFSIYARIRVGTRKERSRYPLVADWRRSLYRWIPAAAGVSLLVLGSSVQAGARYSFQEFSDSVMAAQQRTALDDSAFGEHVSLFSGSTEFVVNDLDIPGNSDLPVRLGRRFVIQDRSGVDTDFTPYFLGGFVDWDIEVPYLEGTFDRVEGWVVGDQSDPQRLKRCTNVRRPFFGAYDAVIWLDNWTGYKMYRPGQGEHKLLKAIAGAHGTPSSGTFPWVTNDNVRLGCLTGTANGYPGEAFVALTPSGDKYYFDWGIERAAAPMTRLKNGIYKERKSVFLLASRIEDRFGNWVKYQYSGDKLVGITSNDGRSITISYEGNRVKTATANGRTWTYAYTSDGTSLSVVTLPDTSQWRYTKTGALDEFRVNGVAVLKPDFDACTEAPGWWSAPFTYQITHPSRAVASFTFQQYRMRHAGDVCTYLNFGNPPYFDVWGLTSKTVSGPGLASQTTTYNVDRSIVSSSAKWTTVTHPDQTKTLYRYGSDITNDRSNEGLLLEQQDLSATGVLLRKRVMDYQYDPTVSTPYSKAIGATLQPYQLADQYVHPLTRVVTTQDGTDFVLQVSSFDTFARPRSVTKSNSHGNSKTETIEYQDDLALWVLGQVKRSTTNSLETIRTDYGWKALPWKAYSFGKLQKTFSYETALAGQVGSLKAVADGNNNVTTLTGWKRGIPQTITFPATTDQPTAVTQKATVDDNGWITSVTDENGYKTCYGHDAMGRVNEITYPSETQVGVCDASAWTPTTITFNGGNPAAYGMPAGHWRQTTLTGRGRKIIIYDAFWRPVVEQTLDLDRVSTSTSEVIRRYDMSGRPEFESYPMNTGGAAVYTDPALKGTHTTYDALDRVTAVKQDSELGVLTTTTAYLYNVTGPYTQVTNPRGAQVRTWYQAYDQPSYDAPVIIQNAGTAFTDIARDPFGKPTSITRRNGSASISETRTYTYNANQELCRQVEPESGATLMGYDGAGNLAWSAAGLPASTACDAEGDTAAILARRVGRGYDARNRLKTMSFPDSEGNQTWTYTPDSLPASVATTMLSDSHIVTNLYAYNRRRLLATETQQITSWGTYTLTRQYDANGHLARLVYPAGYLGSVVDYAPNALGQPTKAGTFASAVTYYPNGAIKSFTYGNGIKHTLTQNLRGLPDTSCDFVTSCDASAVLNDGYDYDPNGNVAAISDGRTGNRGDRDMTYDALDRLTQAVSPMFGTATYAYDPLDNLTHVKLTAGNQIRDHYYCYDATWRLTNVKTGSCAGTTVMGLGYDVQGNLANRSGVVYKFDYGNRLREVVGRENHYWYDGYGRRAGSNRLVNGSSVRRSIYSQDGQLLFVQDQGEGKRKEYIYLGGSLLAERSLPNTGAATPVTVRYQHTDALGSPVAITNESKGVVEKTEYEPYGWAANRTVRNGPGYTGHHEDAATGLVYMQQRYYDPLVQRFLSVDPVEADPDTGDDFNRYAYAYNNPYSFTDPDGRLAEDKKEPPPPPPPPVTLPTVTVTAPKPAPTPTPTTATTTTFPAIEVTAPRPTSAPPIPWPVIGEFITTRLVPPALLFYPTRMDAPPCEMPGGPPCGPSAVFSKGGKQNVRDTGLIGVSDEEIGRRLRDPGTSGKEKRRLQKEQKARGSRNKSKRDENG